MSRDIADTCGKIERFWQTLKKWLRARETSHGPYRTLTVEPRPRRVRRNRQSPPRPTPVARPLPAATQIYRTHVGTGGTISVSRPGATGQLRVHVGGRFKQLPVTVLQDGIRVAVFSGNTLLRALDVYPSKTYQPLHP